MHSLQLKEGTLLLRHLTAVAYKVQQFIAFKQISYAILYVTHFLEYIQLLRVPLEINSRHACCCKHRFSSLF